MLSAVFHFCFYSYHTFLQHNPFYHSPKARHAEAFAPILKKLLLYAGEPVGIELVIPDCCEGQEVVPETRYFGGKEGVGKYSWLRSKCKLHGSALMELADNVDNADILGSAL